MSEFETAGAESHEESAPEPTPGLPPSRRLEVITGVVAAILSAAMIALSRAVVVIRETGGVDPRWWPTVLGILALALSVALVVVAFSRPMSREDVEPTTRSGRINAAATVIAAIAYVLTWPLVGFIPATLVLLVVLTAVFGGRNWKVLTLFPLGLTAFLYTLFAVLLKVPL